MAMGFITGGAWDDTGNIVQSQNYNFNVGDPSLSGSAASGSSTANIPTMGVTPTSNSGGSTGGLSGPSTSTSTSTAPAAASVGTDTGGWDTGSGTTGLPASVGAAATTHVAAPQDFRARLSALHPDDVYGPAKPGIMDILATTGGMLFPYTPTIAFSQAVNYTDLQLVHSNTDYPAYTRTPSVTVSVTGKFTVQNQREGQYALAVIHFLRTVSKSYFGETDVASGKAGLPPPVLLFSAYGPYIFNRLRVILKSHAWTWDENMDTIAVTVGSSTVRIPAMFSITTELTVVQTPQRMRTMFSFDAFASGQLMSSGDGGWI